jgi:drug/metabolite transporter (DMT)-like permease
MTSLAFLLVIASAVCHASWNLLLKSSRHKISFLACAGAVGATVFLPAAVVATAVTGMGWNGVALGCVTAILHGVYGLSLARGYRLGDLSAVYPVSRGTGLALIPVFAALLLGESISAVAAGGVTLVAVGVYAIHLEPHKLRDVLAPLRALRGDAGRAALFTGCLVATYSLWDKNALKELSPLTLNQFAMVGHFAILTPLVLMDRAENVRLEIKERAGSIAAAGVLIAMAYSLILAALTTSRVSYIAPSREIGIVFGTIFGSALLAEGYGRTRVWAALLIVAGVVTLALAP